MSTEGETNRLLKKTNARKKWDYQTFLKSRTVKIVLGVLVAGIIIGIIIHFLYALIKNDNQHESDTSIKTKNPLHISSILPTSNIEYVKKCAPQVSCDQSEKYRRINGSCNNLATPTLGAAVTPFFRLLDANFNDGQYEVRRQTNGSALPSPRVVNIDMFMGRELYHVDENNVLLLPFAQLLAHDISGLPDDILVDERGELISCCTDKIARETLVQCSLAIDYPSDDPVYGKHNVSCVNNYRSLTSRNYSCPLNPATFMNVNTQFIDASEVYGSSEKVTNRLRLMEGGKLRFTVGDNGQMFCPFIGSKAGVEVNTVKPPHSIHYDTGDPNNGNQNLGITAMQTLFLRFHNYIAFKLSAINPNWSDETIYQESRRIVVATIQRIAYKDFLPTIIGDDFQEAYGINDENIYDPTVNSATSQEMSSAAFRVLHSIIPVQFNFMNKNYETEFSVNVTDWTANPVLIPQGNNFDELIKGFVETPGRPVQPSYNFFISNFFRNTTAKVQFPGIDLLSVDVARGRDVGLQPYNRVRQLCGLPLANDFDDLADLIHIKDISKLKKLYHSVYDVDLIVGLLLEKPSDGAIVGPTTRCLIADSFYRLKVGDRFFYDVQDQPGSFTPNQLKVIKEITLGHVLCATTNVDHVQDSMFKAVDHNLFPTSKLKCDDELLIDFDDWVESTA